MAGRHVTDARVRRTRHRLRDAIVSLIHEKSYPAIAVKEILERADVGRSAFYAHFSNKDALLASGIPFDDSASRKKAKTAPDACEPSPDGRFRESLLMQAREIGADELRVGPFDGCALTPEKLAELSKVGGVRAHRVRRRASLDRQVLQER